MTQPNTSQLPFPWKWDALFTLAHRLAPSGLCYTASLTALKKDLDIFSFSKITLVMVQRTHCASFLLWPQGLYCLAHPPFIPRESCSSAPPNSCSFPPSAGRRVEGLGWLPCRLAPHKEARWIDHIPVPLCLTFSIWQMGISRVPMLWGAFVKILNDHWQRTFSTGLGIFQTKYIAMSPFKAMNICKSFTQGSWGFGQFCNRTQM